MDAQPTRESRIAAVRRFNRFYTRTIGVLQEGLLDSQFSLAEARVLYELEHRRGLTASELARDLVREPSTIDRRQSLLSLTETGHAAFAPLDQRSREAVGALLDALPEPAQQSLIDAMARIEILLGSDRSRPWLLRQHRPGDIGWVISRHGALYAEEYGFDGRFEALVAHVAGDFLARHDPDAERCWIAECDGVNVGSVFLVRKSPREAKLRLLLVEPAARGLGIGRRLVAECIAFARPAGYRTVTLWTNEVLVAARAIYQDAGFRLVASQPHNDFGPAMVGEDWELRLR
jgi:GNAT superfamily N-acetyltransferase